MEHQLVSPSCVTLGSSHSAQNNNSSDDGFEDSSSSVDTKVQRIIQKGNRKEARLKKQRVLQKARKELGRRGRCNFHNLRTGKRCTEPLRKGQKKYCPPHERQRRLQGLQGAAREAELEQMKSEKHNRILAKERGVAPPARVDNVAAQLRALALVPPARVAPLPQAMALMPVAPQLVEEDRDNMEESGEDLQEQNFDDVYEEALQLIEEELADRQDPDFVPEPRVEILDDDDVKIDDGDNVTMDESME